MTQPDVRQLPADESLEESPFPAPRQADFRLHIVPEVHRGIAEHAAADTSIEICGVLVGLWKRDADGPFAVVTDYIRCDSASSKFAEVTFTHESWAQINHEMDTHFADSRIIGWYHSHPDFGIFLSDRDRFIQENFFSGAGQVAYVVDPVRKLEGVFAWHGGKPEPVAHYWVGERIIPVESSEKPPGPAAGGPGGGPSTDPTSGSSVASRPAERSPLDFSLLLMALCVFLLGYLLASMKSRWERERIIEGTVAHYGVTNLMRLGFEEQLEETRERLRQIDTEVSALLSLDQSTLDEQQQAEFAQRGNRVSQALSQSRRMLRNVEERYGYTEAERAALARFVAAKQAELSGLLKGTQSSGEKAGSDRQGDSADDDEAEKVEPPAVGPPAPDENRNSGSTERVTE